MFTSLSLMIMPLNGWKIAQVGGSNSDSSRLIAALKYMLVSGHWCTCHWTWEFGGMSWILLGRPRNGLCKCHSEGWPWQGAAVFPSFSGCESKVGLGCGPAHGSRIRRQGWSRWFGQMVRLLGAFVSLIYNGISSPHLLELRTWTETVQARCLVGLFSVYKLFSRC